MAKHDATAEFIVTLMHARTNAHLLHLRSKSYAQHMALGSFYEGIGDLIDKLAENYQGIYGVIDDYPTAYDAPKSDPVIELGYVDRFVSRQREKIPQDTNLQNIVDEIATLVQSTIYKLRNLK